MKEDKDMLKFLFLVYVLGLILVAINNATVIYPHRKELIEEHHYSDMKILMIYGLITILWPVFVLVGIVSMLLEKR